MCLYMLKCHSQLSPFGPHIYSHGYVLTVCRVSQQEIFVGL